VKEILQNSSTGAAVLLNDFNACLAHQNSSTTRASALLSLTSWQQEKTTPEKNNEHSRYDSHCLRERIASAIIGEGTKRRRAPNDLAQAIVATRVMVLVGSATNVEELFQPST
jgi:hypothetical protein